MVACRDRDGPRGSARAAAYLVPVFALLTLRPCACLSVQARHMLVHTKQKPWMCAVCGTRFTQKSALTVHFKRHVQKQPGMAMPSLAHNAGAGSQWPQAAQGALNAGAPINPQLHLQMMQNMQQMQQMQQMGMQQGHQQMGNPLFSQLAAMQAQQILPQSSNVDDGAH